MLYVENMKLGKRLEGELETRGMSPTELCALVPDLNLGTLCATMDRDSGSSKFAPAISDALGLNLRWLLTGEGEKLAQVPKMAHPGEENNGLGQKPYTGEWVSGTESAASSNAAPAPKLGKPGKTPVVGTAQLGDNGFWAEVESPAGHGDGYLEHWSSDPGAYALRCRGDSMKPRIKNGEFVVVEPTTPPNPGDEVMVRAVDGRVMVKELLYVRDGCVHLLSVNEAHGKVVIPLEQVAVMHRITGILNKFHWHQE